MRAAGTGRFPALALLCIIALGVSAGEARAKPATEPGATPSRDEAPACDLDSLAMSLAPGPGKAQLEAVDAQGRTPLARAARDGCMKVVAMLVREGVSLDRSDAKGWTALHEAASQRHADVVDFLLAHGAEQERKTNLGETPLALALAGSREQVGPPGDLHTTEMVLLSGHARQKIGVAAKAPVKPAVKQKKKKPAARSTTKPRPAA